MILTNWYPGHIKPVREGVYQRFLPVSNKVVYSLWRKGYWQWGCNSVTSARKEKFISTYQKIKWRGVVK